MLQTIYSVVHFVYWLVVGGYLMLLPWQPFWEENYFVYRFPAMRAVTVNSFAKWGVLGLGIINLLIGFQEIATFRTSRRHSLSR